MNEFIKDFSNPINLTALVIVVLGIIPLVIFAVMRPKFFRLILKNLGRNVIRTMLIAVSITVLVAIVTLIWTVIYFLDKVTTEQAKDIKLIVTERWQIPSQMPSTHADYLNPDSSKFLQEIKELNILKSNDFMTWSFYGGTLDPTKMTRENLVFFFVMNPDHIRTMMADLDKLDESLIQRLKSNPATCLMGRERMASINKKVGERFKLTSINYKGIDLEFEIIGELPDGRYNQSCIMTQSYFNNELDSYAKKKGVKHPLDDKRLNLIWLRVPDRASFDKLGEIVENSSAFSNRPVKVETESSGVGNFLDAYRVILDGMKYLLVPTILIIMILVVANAISISVRERRTEIAVLKVLGYRPNLVLFLVLGESILVGLMGGFIAALATYGLINWVVGGVKFPIAFFPAFLIPEWGLIWGPAMGCAAAFLGSFFPAWNARTVRVTEVFSKVA